MHGYASLSENMRLNNSYKNPFDFVKTYKMFLLFYES